MKKINCTIELAPLFLQIHKLNVFSYATVYRMMEESNFDPSNSSLYKNMSVEIEIETGKKPEMSPQKLEAAKKIMAIAEKLWCFSDDTMECMKKDCGMGESEDSSSMPGTENGKAPMDKGASPTEDKSKMDLMSQISKLSSQL